MKHTIRIKPVAEREHIEFPDPLGFGRIFSDRMFTQRYSEDRGWHDAEIGAYQASQLDPATTVFHNGQMIFDGTKGYRRDDGNNNFFRTDLNSQRFNLSAHRIG